MPSSADDAIRRADEAFAVGTVIFEAMLRSSNHAELARLRAAHTAAMLEHEAARRDYLVATGKVRVQ